MAFHQYFEGLNYAAKHLDSCSLGDFTSALGTMYYQQDLFAKAIPYFKDAFYQYSSCEISSEAFYYRFTLSQGMLNTIALCYEKNGQPDSAVRYYQQAIDYIQREGRFYPEKKDFIASAIAVIKGNLGGSMVLLGKYREAEAFLKESIRINDRPGFAVEDALTARLKLADLYLAQTHTGKASLMLDSIHSKMDSFYSNNGSEGLRSIMPKYLYLKWRMYDKTGNLPMAYASSRKFHLYRDSVRQLKNELYHADVEQALADYHQDYELSLLSKENDLKNAYLVCAAIIVATILTIALVIWKNLQRFKQHVHVLKAMNAEKRSLVSALLQSEKDNAHLIRIVAHDLRNPLSAINAMADLIEQGKLSVSDLEAIAPAMKSAGSKALSLVNDMLQVKIHEEKFPVNLEELLRCASDLVRHKITGKGQEILLQTEPIILFLNQHSLWRVFTNLLDNASKFSPAGSVITVKLTGNELGVVIQISDQGIGIPEELKTKVFQAVSQAQRLGTEGEQSFGIGLSVAKQIIEQQGGKIWFETVENKGTSFFVFFPGDHQPKQGVQHVSTTSADYS